MKLDKSYVIGCTSLKERRLIWGFLLKNGFIHKGRRETAKDVEAYSNYNDYPNVIVTCSGEFSGRANFHDDDELVSFAKFKEEIASYIKPFKVGDIVTCLWEASSCYSYTKDKWEGCIISIDNGVFDARTLIDKNGVRPDDPKTYNRLSRKYFKLKEEVKEKTEFKIGDCVRAISQSFGWGEIKKGAVGKIASFCTYNSSIIIVDFPRHKGWEGKACDFELLLKPPVTQPKKEKVVSFGTRTPKPVEEKIIKPKTIKKEEKEMATKPTIIDRAKAATAKTVKAQTTLVQNAAVLEGARILGNEIVKIAKKKAPMMVRGYIDTPFGKAALMNAVLIGMETACPDLDDSHPYKQVANAAVVVSYQEVIQSFNIQEMIEDLFSKGDLKKAVEKIK